LKYLHAFILASLSIFASYVYAGEPATNEVFVGKHFMSLVLNQEKNGKRGFRLQFEKVKKPVTESQLQLAGYEITSQKYSFNVGEQTLLFRFNAKKEKEKRTILVLYSGTLSVLAGTDNYYFYVAEEYQKSIRYYAMFNSEPSFESVSKIVESALNNPDGALVATRWAGKESEVFIYDNNRLTK
jgi:hypothetical protein